MKHNGYHNWDDSDDDSRVKFKGIRKFRMDAVEEVVVDKDMLENTGLLVAKAVSKGIIGANYSSVAIDPLKGLVLGYCLSDRLGLTGLTYFIDPSRHRESALVEELKTPLTVQPRSVRFDEVPNNHFDLIVTGVSNNLPYSRISEDFNRLLPKLRDGGTIGIVGRKKGSIKQVIKLNPEFPFVTAAGFIFMTANGEMNYTTVERFNYEAEVNQVHLKINTTKGVFSCRHLDPGTRELLEIVDKYPINSSDRVLDICCGCGPIGIYVAKRFGCRVDLTDIDENSSELAKENVIQNGVADLATVYQGDGVENLDSRYDYVFSNLPGHCGGENLDNLVRGSYGVLHKHGRFTSVIPKLVAVEDLLEKYFGRFKELRVNQDYKFLEAIK